MTYLLSLLRSELSSTEDSPSEKEPGSICYYVNDTKFVQNIRIIAKHECIFEYLAFPNERILFKAPDKARLKVNTFLLNRVKTSELECQRLHIAEE